MKEADPAAIDPAYVDVAIERWEMITGQEAQKASTDRQ
jgi:hypothetical protein